MGYLPMVAIGGLVRAMLWSAVAILAVLALGLVVMLAKRWQQKSLNAQPQDAFSVDAIEKLRNSGELTREEFTRLRRAAMGLEPATDEKKQTMSSTGVKVDDERMDNEEG